MPGSDLNELLASRIVGKGYSRISPQGHSSMASEFRPVERAMGMLPEATQDTMPNVKVDTREIPFGWYNQQKQASIDRENPSGGITLVGGAPLFKAAQKGNPKALQELASILVHEQFHLNHEPGEGPAYDAQLAMLRQLGAPKSLIQDVQRAKDVAK